MRRAEWGLVAGLGAVLVPGWLAMAEVWSRVDYYSHGYLVPLVALWAASAKRFVLPTLPAERDWRGLAVIGVALL
ncbi:MAG: archaeosortase/exosortase family protein, partial [Deltaproteobacteria bacterium]|nr:archaeosortase/exosortase family protein [Deltaproteobacteria bacterium]